MAGPASKVAWKIVGKMTGIVAGAAATRASTWLYRRLRRSAPPTNPAHPDTRWPEAIGWAVLSGVALEVGRLSAERLAARGWVRATGSLPPGMNKDG